MVLAAALEPLRELAEKTLPALENGAKERNFSQTTWANRLLPDMLLQRDARLRSQRWVTGFYVGVALVGLTMPMVDIYGLAFGRSDFSLFFTSLGYLTFWAALAARKYRSISTEVRNEIARVLEAFNDVENTRPMTEGRWRNGLSRIKSLARPGVRCGAVMGT